MPPHIDLIGRIFGRLTVVKFKDMDKGRNSRWLCSCNCGTTIVVKGYNLKSGRTKSCGCLNKEIITKHGHNQKGKRTKTHISWTNMIQRCTNFNHYRYKDYGCRGITVCKRWRKFENFLADMGEVPKGHQIDRINNNGNYCKLNCRWVTSKQNSRNRRDNCLITYNRKTQCLFTWAEEFNIHWATLRSRIYTLNWPIERALTEPVQKRRKR